MKNFSLLVAPVLVCLVASTVYAQNTPTPSGKSIQVETSKDNKDTIHVLLSGSALIDGVGRSAAITANRGGVAGSDGGHSQFSIEGQAHIRLDLDFVDKISGTIGIANKRLAEGTTNTLGMNPEGTGLIFDELSMTVGDILDSSIKVSLGIIPVVFDVRGKGSAFFFDPRHSSTFAKNRGVPLTSGATVFGRPDELQPAGVQGTYSKDNVSLGVFLLPAIIEGGDAVANESAYGAWTFIKLDSIGKGSRIGALAVIDKMSGPDSTVFTIGGGADIYLMNSALELYGEVYLQFGNVGRIGDTTIKQAAVAGQVGGEYHLNNTSGQPWFGGCITWATGDDTPADDTSNAFLSYENINDLKILEDQTYGIDLDTNYLSFKVKGGVTWLLGPQTARKTLDVTAILGINTLLNDVAGSKAIGHEFDVISKFNLTKQIAVQGGAGVLFGADVLRSTGSTDDNTAFLAWIGMLFTF